MTRGRGRRCVLACMVAGLLVAALRRVAARYRRGGNAVTTTVLQAYRFAVDPTPTQEAALRSHCGAQRFAFNWGLALVTANLGQRHAETSYGIPVDEVTPAVGMVG